MAAKAIYKFNFVVVKFATGGYRVSSIRNPKAHTHVAKFETAISMIKLVHNKQLPRNRSSHFIESLCRLSDDKDYIDRLQDLNLDYADMMSHGEIDVGRCLGR